MLDIGFIREQPEQVKKALQNRGVDFDVEHLLEVDRERRAKIKEVDDLRARQNEYADVIQGLIGAERDEKIAESKKTKIRLGELEKELSVLEQTFSDMMRRMPNIPLASVPVGRDERDNVVLREVGKKPQFSSTPRDYMDIASKLSLVDVERAAKVSGSRFGYIKNELVFMEFALVAMAFDMLSKKGCIPVLPPVMIRKEMMENLGYVDTDKDRAERYYLSEDELYFVGTAEQSLVPMHADEVMHEKQLPLRYAAFSTCFRREAGSYGKDTHGILRVHQFDKVEMVTFARPEDAEKEHQLMIAIQEDLMQALQIPYRVVALCTGDIAGPSAATVDIESWLPGQNGGAGEYRETHSSSNTTDFQARRLGIKYHSARGGRAEFVHILNGTACAIGRTLIAIMENYQTAEGSVRVPEALQPFMGGMKIIARP